MPNYIVTEQPKIFREKSYHGLSRVLSAGVPVPFDFKWHARIVEQHGSSMHAKIFRKQDPLAAPWRNAIPYALEHFRLLSAASKEAAHICAIFQYEERLRSCDWTVLVVGFLGLIVAHEWVQLCHDNQLTLVLSAGRL